jgi:hypothetical protein
MPRFRVNHGGLKAMVKSHLTHYSHNRNYLLDTHRAVRRKPRFCRISVICWEAVRCCPSVK